MPISPAHHAPSRPAEYEDWCTIEAIPGAMHGVNRITVVYEVKTLLCLANNSNSYTS